MLGLALAGAACKNSPTAPSLPATFTLEPGETARVNTTLVTFVRVVSDSRCPINAICVWAGEATAAFEVFANGLNAQLDLQIVDAQKRSVDVRGITFELKSLLPHPFAGQPTKPGDYRATIEIR